ncbi:hypothetical protein GOP47_0004462 [Adiantum capillus-veneris]|uniref:Uncharacterized protein n=1 Tax=Adiantum capillus-veneris TaxID=13818 RepID=A0A9D4ZMV1_ADICA|nr:hypothetical protein GOP47_0004462 [Adiantum capillus-veneris]
MGRPNSVISNGGQDQSGTSEKTPLESRFKAEANVRRCPPCVAPPTSTPISSIAVPSPLYDEVELAGLKTQMADFVQRMQLKHHADQKAIKSPVPAEASASAHEPPPRRPPPPPPAEEVERDIRRSISSSAEVSGFRRPISAIHRFFRRVISGRSFSKSSNSATAAAQLEHEAPAPLINEVQPEAIDDMQHHYHHYIHHHHHHYHYGDGSPEDAEFNATPRARRRHSESSGFRPRIPALTWEENEVNPEDDWQESPLSAFLPRRRRHSTDSTFAEAAVRYSPSWKPQYVGKVRWTPDKLGPAKRSPELVQAVPRRYNSERFTNGTKVTQEWKEDVVEVRGGRWQSADVKSRRRLSEESLRDGAAMEGKRAGVRAGEGAGGGTYKLSANYERKPALGRRHSESFVDASRRRVEKVVHEELQRNGYFNEESDQSLKGRSLLRPPSPAAYRQHRQPASRSPLPPVYRLSNYQQ